MITGVFHNGVRVVNLERSIELFEHLGYTIETRFTKDILKCHAAIVRRGDHAFELFEFEDTIHEWVGYISNPIAFYSDDIEADIADFIARGYKLVTQSMMGRYSVLRTCKTLLVLSATKLATQK